MGNAARLALTARRNEVARFTIAVTGIDLTGVNMAMQVRLRPDTPGAPLIALATADTTAAEGLKVDSVTYAGVVPTSVIKGRINASTMTDASKVPYTGEVGDNSCLAYAMQWTLDGDAQTRIYGDFIVVASAFGSDAAPASRPVGYGGTQRVGVGDTGTLTFGDQIINVAAGGSDLLLPLVAGSEARSADLVYATRDHRRRLRQKIGRGEFGTQTYSAGLPMTTKTTIGVVLLGDSHGTSQGASVNTVVAMLHATFAKWVPNAILDIRVFAVPGSWQTQMGEQIDAMNAAGFSPDISIIFTGTNDASPVIFHSLEGPIVFRQQLQSNIRRLAAISWVWLPTKPAIHPTWALAEGRMDMSPDFFMTYPVVGFVAADGYQAFIYDAEAQTLRNSTPGAFKIFANNVLAPGQWLRIDPRVYGAPLFVHIWDWDTEGSVLLLDDGTGAANASVGPRGGPILPYSTSNTYGLYQGKFDARAQLVPARNEDDLSRPAGVAANVPLAIEPRDLSGTGALVNASLRHLVANRIIEDVGAEEAATVLPWARKTNKRITSNAAHDTVMSDAYHYNDVGYGDFGAVADVEVAALVDGL
jgi:hypothetical protein